MHTILHHFWARISRMKCSVLMRLLLRRPQQSMCWVQGLKDLHTLCYAWRADAEAAWEGGGRFYPGAAMSCHSMTTRQHVQQQMVRMRYATLIMRSMEPLLMEGSLDQGCVTFGSAL